MNVKAIRSDSIYEKIRLAPDDKKNDIYRYELMMPFERKWACYNIPMKAKTHGGYDIIMASRLFGHIEPTKVDETQKQNIQLIADNTLWEKCETAIRKSLSCFTQQGIDLPVKSICLLYCLQMLKAPTSY